jgi:hypothetical protein
MGRMNALSGEGHMRVGVGHDALEVLLAAVCIRVHPCNDRARLAVSGPCAMGEAGRRQAD